MKIKYKIITIVAIGLAGIVSIIAFLILPYQQKLLDDQAALIETRKKIISQQEELQKILQNSQQLKNLDQGEINSIFIQKNKALDFINSIEKIAERNNCELSIKLSEPADANYTELNLQMVATSEWQNILALINELEKQSFYLNYQSIQVLPASATFLENTETTDKITANIEAITYWQ